MGEPVEAKVVASVETLWEAVLKTREQAAPVVQLLSQAPDAEVVKSGARVLGIEGQAWSQGLSERFIGPDGGVEKVRPFVGERVWSLYFAYRAVVARVASKTVKGLSQGGFKAWHLELGGDGLDQDLVDILDIVFDIDEIKKILAEREPDTLRKILGRMETLLMAEVHSLLHGDSLSAEVMARVQGMLAAAQKEPVVVEGFR